MKTHKCLDIVKYENVSRDIQLTNQTEVKESQEVLP